MDAETRSERAAATRDSMHARGFGLLALAPSDDFLYLVGFAPTADERACLLLLGEHDTVCVVPELNAQQLHAEVPEIELVPWADENGPRRALAEALKRVAATTERISVDAAMRADHLLLLQEQLPHAAYASSAEVLAPLRMRKSLAEIEQLRTSAQTADVAMQAAFSACHAGTTELDVAEAAAAAFRREGCEEVLFTVVAAGANGAFPHHHSTRRRLQEGDPIVIDIGGRLGGYASDITRMAVLGPPSERYREVHDNVEAAVAAALAAASPGATCEDVDAAARRVIEQAGYGAHFSHRTGHGLGLSGHEPPSIVAGEGTKLEPGMVFSIEPGIYLPGEFGVRLEETVVVGDNGSEILSVLGREAYIGLS